MYNSAVPIRLLLEDYPISGVVAFAGLMAFFMSRPSSEIQLQEKLVFACFFTGAIFCMGLSFLYHTLCCNQDKKIGRLFAKFDYCGISFLTVGSFVPWLYYSFYCDIKPQMIYLSIVILLGIGAVVVSTFDFFAGIISYRVFGSELSSFSFFSL